MNISIKKFNEKIFHQGYFLFKDYFSPTFVNKMARDLDISIYKCKKLQKLNKIKDATSSAHHILLFGKSFIDLIKKKPIDKYLRSFFNGNYILNSIGGANNMNERKSYYHLIHRDIKSYQENQRFLLNTLICLDDFNYDNGPIEILPIRNLKNKPSNNFFDKNKIKIIARKGSLLAFDSNLWHRAGINKSQKPRRSITPMFSKPFYKQQFEYWKILKKEKLKSKFLKDILGYNSRVPDTIKKWYVGKRLRYYKADQR